MIIKEEQLELIEFKLDEYGDIQAVSIVTDPAIDKGFQLFKATKVSTFKSIEDKQEITGPVMVPNMPILRQKPTGEYFNCFFTDETVKQCAAVYLKNCNHLFANFEHQNNFTSSIYTIESWIVTDPQNDKSKALGFQDVQPGTWFMTYKVDSPELWNEIKKSGFTGFSIEGYFSYFEKIKEDDKKLENIRNIILSSLSDTDKEILIIKIIGTI